MLGIALGAEWAYRFFLPEMPDFAVKAGGQQYKVEGDETEPWASMVEYTKNHQAAYPLKLDRVPPSPRLNLVARQLGKRSLQALERRERLITMLGIEAS